MNNDTKYVLNYNVKMRNNKKEMAGTLREKLSPGLEISTCTFTTKHINGAQLARFGKVQFP